MDHKIVVLIDDVRHLPVSAAAKVLGITRQSVHARIRTGTLPAVEVGGKKYVPLANLTQESGDQ